MPGMAIGSLTLVADTLSATGFAGRGWWKRESQRPCRTMAEGVSEFRLSSWNALEERTSLMILLVACCFTKLYLSLAARGRFRLQVGLPTAFCSSRAPWPWVTSGICIYLRLLMMLVWSLSLSSLASCSGLPNAIRVPGECASVIVREL